MATVTRLRPFRFVLIFTCCGLLGFGILFTPAVQSLDVQFSRALVGLAHGPAPQLMRALEPQARFLLRGSALLIVLLTLWWFVLLGPMLYLLKGAAGAFVSIEETSTGDWSLRVPLDKIVAATPEHPVAQQ